MTLKLQQRIDDRLKRIANILLLNASFINNLGLLNGKMGIAIFFYHYARYTGNNVYETFAGELIDEIYEGINARSSIDFTDGLTGIGWGIEYLVQNGFIEADTDDVLEDIDEAVYQKILFQLTYNELQGCILYQLARFRARTSENNDQRMQLKKHTLLCLLGECEKLLIYRKYKDLGFPNLATLNTIQFFLTEMDKAELFPSKTKKLRECLSSFFEMSTSEKKEADHANIVDHATFLIWQQLVYPSDISLRTDITSLCKAAIDYIDEEDNWKKRIDNLDIEGFGLDKGIAGIAMLLLSNSSSLSNLLSVQFQQKEIDDKRDKLHLFLIVHDFSGARTYTDELSLYFSKKNNVVVHQIFLNSIEHKELFIQNERNINSIYIPLLLPEEYDRKYYKYAALLLYSHLSHLSNVIFHANMPEQYYFAEEAKKLFNCSLVFTLHFLENFYSYMDKYPEHNGDIEITGNAKLKSILELADQIVCVTEFSKRTIIKLYNIDPLKTSIIYNGKIFPNNKPKEIRKDKCQYGFDSDDKLILYAGQLEPRKGVDKLIKAFLLIKDKFPSIKLVIAGKGEYDKYMPLAKECLGRVYFTGKLDKDTLIDFYCFSDIGILPSQFEQCSYVAIEMMHYGLPIIISDVPGLNELISQGKTGLVCKVKPNDTIPNALEVNEMDLVLQIDYLFRNKTEAKKMAQAAHRCALNRHSLKNMGEETLKIYRKLINKNINDVCKETKIYS